jgi:hypothetical protein
MVVDGLRSEVVVEESQGSLGWAWGAKLDKNDLAPADS